MHPFRRRHRHVPFLGEENKSLAVSLRHVLNLRLYLFITEMFRGVRVGGGGWGWVVQCNRRKPVSALQMGQRVTNENGGNATARTESVLKWAAV